MLKRLCRFVHDPPLLSASAALSLRFRRFFLFQRLCRFVLIQRIRRFVLFQRLFRFVLFQRIHRFVPNVARNYWYYANSI